MSVTGLDVVGLFAESGRRAYGEQVTQLQHALQCASHARRDRADDEVVLAALLHDLGHLVTAESDTPAHHHGSAAAGLLRPHVSPRVAWLVEHHVIAKRYLVTMDPRYGATLSPASRRSLVAQGEGLAPDEVARLERHAWFGDAVRLRRWDDAAKDPGAQCDPLIVHRSLLESCFGPQPWMGASGIDR